jgi:pimeloyl-ACP methyl ester carboxylesterase
VQWEAPGAQAEWKLPVVLVHGGGGQSTDWMWTIDGRPGWAQLFVEAGHPTYLIDRPGHGRSTWDPETMGTRAPVPDVSFLRTLFQFEDRAEDDESVGVLAASSTGLLHDAVLSQSLDAGRLSELLHRIGPALIVTHSAGAPGGWLVADRDPDLVRALVAVEPLGPPFGGLRHADALRCGITASVLSLPNKETAEHRRGLARVPVLVVSAESSGHAAADAQTALFLANSGVEVEHMELGRLGLHGDGHGVVFDTNSTSAFRLVHNWCLSVLSRTSTDQAVDS